MAGDTPLMARGLQNMLDSGQLPADKVAIVGLVLGQIAYQGKDYAGAIKALTPIVAANSSENAAAEMLADSYFKQGQPAQGLAALKAAISARRAAAGTVPESWFTRANTIAYNAKLANEGTEWAQMMVAANPTPVNWLGAGQLVRLYGNFGTQDSVDISRLMFRAGALNGKSKEIEREYVEYLQAADPRRLPGEVVKVGDAAIAAGALRATDTFVADSLSQARGRIAADKASLPTAAKQAQASPTGLLAMATGDAFLSYGMDAQAEDLYKLAIQKGGIDKDKATLRLGIAQTDAGKSAEAKATFGQVGGKSSPIAKLWSTYIDANAGGKAS
jgi:tetratricopeptide (TPR) repeat protein